MRVRGRGPQQGVVAGSAGVKKRSGVVVASSGWSVLSCSVARGRRVPRARRSGSEEGEGGVGVPGEQRAGGFGSLLLLACASSGWAAREAVRTQVRTRGRTTPCLFRAGKEGNAARGMHASA